MLNDVAQTLSTFIVTNERKEDRETKDAKEEAYILFSMIFIHSSRVL
jgi:hypothetical protein